MIGIVPIMLRMMFSLTRSVRSTIFLRRVPVIGGVPLLRRSSDPLRNERTLTLHHRSVIELDRESPLNSTIHTAPFRQSDRLRFNLFKEVCDSFSNSTRLRNGFSQFFRLHEFPSSVEIIEFAKDYEIVGITVGAE